MDVLTDQIKHITQMSADEAGLATAKFIKENLFYLNCIHSAFAIHRNGWKFLVVIFGEICYGTDKKFFERFRFISCMSSISLQSQYVLNLEISSFSKESLRITWFKVPQDIYELFFVFVKSFFRLYEIIEH